MGFATRIVGGLLLVGIGVGVVVVAANAPTLLRTARPVLRSGLKRGLAAYQSLRGAAADFAEDVEDLIAEVQAELKDVRPTPEAPTPGEVKEA